MSLPDLLVDNIRRRLMQDEHVTLTLLRYEHSGRVLFSGAHEEMLVCRAESGNVETFFTEGTWVGITTDYAETLQECEFVLAPGDLLLLYTDGVTEARNERGQMFGIERLKKLLAEHRQASVAAIRDTILTAVRAWLSEQSDDLTLLVARRS